MIVYHFGLGKGKVDAYRECADRSRSSSWCRSVMDSSLTGMI